MKIFILLSENPLKVKKTAAYSSLISFLVPELLSFKDLKTDRKTKDCAVLDKIN